MTRNDAIELAGIGCVFAAAIVLVYGLALVAMWAALVAAGLFLLLCGLVCIGVANRADRRESGAYTASRPSPNPPPWGRGGPKGGAE